MCTHCLREQEPSAFSPRAGGLQSWCRECKTATNHPPLDQEPGDPIAVEVTDRLELLVARLKHNDIEAAFPPMRRVTDNGRYRMALTSLRHRVPRRIREADE